VHKANRLRKCVTQIHTILTYRQQPSIDQLHYMKKLCEEKLREDTFSDDDDSDREEGENFMDESRNCTLDENESIIVHPKVVQANFLKRYSCDDEYSIREKSSPKRFRCDQVHPSSQQFVAKSKFDFSPSAYNDMPSPHTTRPFTVTTDMQQIDTTTTSNSDTSLSTMITSKRKQTSDESLSSIASSNIDSRKFETTSSSSSIEQTLPIVLTATPVNVRLHTTAKEDNNSCFTPMRQNNDYYGTPTKNQQPAQTAHRFISRGKIFKMETCFVCYKRINFVSVSFKCSQCLLSCHFDCKENYNGPCSQSSSTNNSIKTPVSSSLKYLNANRLIHSEPKNKKKQHEQLFAATPTNKETPSSRRLRFDKI